MNVHLLTARSADRVYGHICEVSVETLGLEVTLTI